MISSNEEAREVAADGPFLICSQFSRGLVGHVKGSDISQRDPHTIVVGAWGGVGIYQPHP